MAEVPHSEVDRGAVTRCGQHHLSHDPWYVNLLLSLALLGRLLLSRPPLIWNAVIILLFKVVGYSVLFLELFPGVLR